MHGRIACISTKAHIDHMQIGYLAAVDSIDDVSQGLYDISRRAIAVIVEYANWEDIRIVRSPCDALRVIGLRPYHPTNIGSMSDGIVHRGQLAVFCCIPRI